MRTRRLWVSSTPTTWRLPTTQRLSFQTWPEPTTRALLTQTLWLGIIWVSWLAPLTKEFSINYGKWGSEYQTFKIQNHQNTELFVWYWNGRCLVTKLTWNSGQYWDEFQILDIYRIWMYIWIPIVKILNLYIILSYFFSGAHWCNKNTGSWLRPVLVLTCQNK